MTLRIARILHAGYVFSCGGVEIAFDPVFENPFSRNCHAFPPVRFDVEAIRQQRFDAVFISHYHDDHCSLDSLDLLPRSTPIYLYCLFEELFDMLRALGFEQVHQLRTNAPVHVGPFQVTPREALDADVDAMFQIQAEGRNILNVVDAWIAPDIVEQLAALGPWDMVLWPFQTMRELDVLSPSRATPGAPTLPEEFIEQLQRLAPRVVVPSSCQFVQESWSWYNHAMFPITYAQFQREVEQALPDAQVLRLNPSVAVEFAGAALLPAAPLAWVIPVGAQDGDFEYDPTRPVPSTADIARRLDRLDASEFAAVMQFCEHGLAERFKAMEPSDSPYFDSARVWRLKVYGHDGAPASFHYRVCGEHIERIGDDDVPAWLTEVPAAKLYGALARGEALTSMYLRVNDTVFDPATEAELDEAEVIEDPLIRCLFNGVFGAYQAAQLARLLRRR